MKEFNGTKGKWVCRKNKYGPGYYVSTMSKNEIFDIAYLDAYSCQTIKEVKANAKLIAASPDLLEAAIEALRYVCIEEPAYSLLEKAINKALGL